MKNKFQILLASLALSVLPAQAQIPFHADFLTVPAVYATNTLAITNLATGGSVGTNLAGTTYTNNGVRVVVSAAGSGANRNLIKDVPLLVDRNGNPLNTTITNVAAANSLLSALTVSITATAGSGANAAVTFVMTPLWDGENEATEAADLWTFSFTPTASTTHTWSTNVPVMRFMGAEALRLKRIVNADTDASSQVIITAVRLNGFSP